MWKERGARKKMTKEYRYVATCRYRREETEPWCLDGIRGFYTDLEKAIESITIDENILKSSPIMEYETIDISADNPDVLFQSIVKVVKVNWCKEENSELEPIEPIYFRFAVEKREGLGRR